MLANSHPTTSVSAPTTTNPRRSRARTNALRSGRISPNPISRATAANWRRRVATISKRDRQRVDNAEPHPDRSEDDDCHDAEGQGRLEDVGDDPEVAKRPIRSPAGGLNREQDRPADHSHGNCSRDQQAGLGRDLIQRSPLAICWRRSIRSSIGGWVENSLMTPPSRLRDGRRL